MIIAGFHRSGTSLLTQLLHAGGLFVGDDLLGAGPTNPYGHFEDREVLSLHRAVLERHGDDWQWDAPFPFRIGRDHWRRMRSFVLKRELRHPVWGFKDPRVCLFIGAWKHVNPDVKVVVVFRDPGECVRSMESRSARALLQQEGNPQRHGRFFSEPDHGLKLWDTYNRALVAFVRSFPEDCLVLPFEAVAGSGDVVERVNDRFGLSLDQARTAGVFDPEVTSQREAPQPVFAPRTEERVLQTWRELQELSETTGAR
nr:sulfotransferase [Nocardioides perillae]